jgi:hypothetical protein
VATDPRLPIEVRPDEAAPVSQLVSALASLILGRARLVVQTRTGQTEPATKKRETKEMTSGHPDRRPEAETSNPLPMKGSL